MAHHIHDGNYILRVTARGSDGVGLTIGFMVNAEAYDALKDIHSFDVENTKYSKHVSAVEHTRICTLVKAYLKNKDEPDESN